MLSPREHLEFAQLAAEVSAATYGAGLESCLANSVLVVRPYLPTLWHADLIVYLEALPPAERSSLALALRRDTRPRGLSTRSYEHVLFGIKDYVLDQHPDSPESTLPRLGRELLAWAEAEGLVDALAQPAPLPPGFEYEPLLQSAWQGRRATFEEVLTSGTGDALESLVGRYRLRLVRAQASLLLAARAEQGRADSDKENQLWAQLAPQVPDEARVLFEWLEAAFRSVRKTHRPLAFRPERAAVDLVTLQPVAIAVTEDFGYGSVDEYGRVVTHLYLQAESPEELRVACSCRFPNTAHPPCRHTAGALESLATRLADPAALRTLRPVLGELARPAWQRFIETLPEPEGLDPDTFGFRVRLGPPVSVEPVFVSGAGRRAKVRGMKREDLSRALTAELAAPVRRALELIDTHWMFGATRAVEDATAHRVLLALIGQPRVFLLQDRVTSELSVEPGGPSLRLMQDSAGQIRLIGGGDEPLDALAERMRVACRAEIYVALEGQVLRVGRVSQRLSSLIAHARRGAIAAPAEAAPALLARLQTLEADGVIERDQTLKGRAVAPRCAPFWRLARDGEFVYAQIRIRPLDTASFPAGDGPVEVYGRDERDGTLFYAQRDLGRERSAADELRTALELPPCDVETGRWRFAGEAAADFVARLAETPQADQVEWERDPLVVRRPLQLGALRLKVRKDRDWFRLTGLGQTDEMRIDLAALLEAARLEKRFVAVGPGEWLPLAASLRERLLSLADYLHPEGDRTRLDRLAAPVIAALREEAAVDAEPEWDLAEARYREAQKIEPVLPPGFKAELRPYQLEGFRWLSRMAAWGMGACLADDMGLGKTVQALAVVLARASGGPALIVAPTSLLTNWKREAARFAPELRLSVYEGDAAARQQKVELLGPHDVLLVSYGLLVQDSERIGARGYHTLVLDEAHVFKNAGTLRAKVVHGLDAEWAVALTGTPVENRASELWSLFRRLVPGLFGSLPFFRERFLLPIERGERGPARSLGRLIRPFVLRRTKVEVADDLPAKTQVVIEVELEPRHRRLYEDARLAALAQLVIPSLGPKRQEARIQVLAALTRLRQLACHVRLAEPDSEIPSAKLERLLELVTTLRDEGHQVLVFSQFVRHLDLVDTALAEAEITRVRLDGSMPIHARADAVDRFQRGEAAVFLLSLKAGGTGLNLTAADYVIHLDPWWNPAVEDQATDRAHRIGQRRPVTVYRLIAKDTVEEQILALHAEKRELVEALLEGSDAAGKLSLEALVDLMRSPEPAAETQDEASLETKRTPGSQLAAVLATQDEASTELRAGRALETPAATLHELVQCFAEYLHQDAPDLDPATRERWIACAAEIVAIAEREQSPATYLALVSLTEQALARETVPEPARREALEAFHVFTRCALGDV